MGPKTSDSKTALKGRSVTYFCGVQVVTVQLRRMKLQRPTSGLIGHAGDGRTKDCVGHVGDEKARGLGASKPSRHMLLTKRVRSHRTRMEFGLKPRGERRDREREGGERGKRERDRGEREKGRERQKGRGERERERQRQMGRGGERGWAGREREGERMRERERHRERERERQRERAAFLCF